MVDLGAVNDRVAGLLAGMNLEMPSSHGLDDRLILEAIQNGTLAEEKLDKTCERIIRVIYKFVDSNREDVVLDHELVQSIIKNIKKRIKIEEVCIAVSLQFFICFLSLLKIIMKQLS